MDRAKNSRYFYLIYFACLALLAVLSFYAGTHFSESSLLVDTIISVKDCPKKIYDPRQTTLATVLESTTSFATVLESTTTFANVLESTTFTDNLTSTAKAEKVYGALLKSRLHFQLQYILADFARSHRHERSPFAKEIIYTLFLKTHALWKHTLNLTLEEKISEEKFDICPANVFTTTCPPAIASRPVDNLLSIVLDGAASLDNAQNVLLAIQKYDFPMQIFVIMQEGSEKSLIDFIQINCPQLTVHVVPIKFDADYTLAWSRVLLNVRTQYVLIGRGLTYIDEHTDVHRLIRMIDYFDYDFVAGSHRNATGHWRTGCYLTSIKNYEYRLVESYDLTYNSCLVCDYVTGPFVARTKTLVDLLDDKYMGTTYFVNLFELAKRRGYSTVLCASVMFYTETSHRVFDISYNSWAYFASEWEINKVTIPEWEPMYFGCAKRMASCTANKGMSLPPCCLQTLSKMLRFLMATCERNGIDCEIEAGTLVGGLKFSGTLPWEKDADINLRAAHHEKLKSLTHKFTAQGYTLTETNSAADCWFKTNDSYNVNCGYFALRNNNWRIELWGSTLLGSDWLTVRNVTSFTKMLVDGQWMTTYPNPLLYARNMYGDDMFEHVEHWITLGYGTGWKPYTTGGWLKCPKPSHHACLDKFAPTGNWQFKEIVI